MAPGAPFFSCTAPVAQCGVPIQVKGLSSGSCGSEYSCEVHATTMCCLQDCCRLATATSQPLPQRLESKWLAKIMLIYIERHHDAFAALFDLMAVFSGPMGEQHMCA